LAKCTKFLANLTNRSKNIIEANPTTAQFATCRMPSVVSDDIVTPA